MVGAKCLMMMADFVDNASSWSVVRPSVIFAASVVTAVVFVVVVEATGVLSVDVPIVDVDGKRLSLEFSTSGKSVKSRPGWGSGLCRDDRDVVD